METLQTSNCRFWRCQFVGILHRINGELGYQTSTQRTTQPVGFTAEIKKICEFIWYRMMSFTRACLKIIAMEVRSPTCLSTYFWVLILKFKMLVSGLRLPWISTNELPLKILTDNSCYMRCSSNIMGKTSWLKDSSDKSSKDRKNKPLMRNSCVCSFMGNCWCATRPEKLKLKVRPLLSLEILEEAQDL